jgi:hypothetical protein
MLLSMPDLAGRYADQGRYVLTDGGQTSFPSLAELPALMGDLRAGWCAGYAGECFRSAPAAGDDPSFH